MTTQIRNNEMVNLLRADFQARYEPNFAMANAISVYMSMPGLRGFWPFSSVNETGNLYDISGQGRIMNQINTPVFSNYNLASYANFNGVNQYFSRADEAGLDVLGTESYMSASLRGLTITAWIRVINYNLVGVDGIFGKTISGNVPNSNFILGSFNGDLSWYVFSGANFYVINSTLAAGQWAFVCCRYDPSTVIQITINGVTASNAVGIPASLNNSTAPLIFGLNNGTANYHDGDMSFAALYAAYLTDAQVSVLYEQSRALFGV